MPWKGFDFQGVFCSAAADKPRQIASPTWARPNCPGDQRPWRSPWIAPRVAAAAPLPLSAARSQTRHVPHPDSPSAAAGQPALETHLNLPWLKPISMSETNVSQYIIVLACSCLPFCFFPHILCRVQAYASVQLLCLWFCSPTKKCYFESYNDNDNIPSMLFALCYNTATSEDSAKGLAESVSCGHVACESRGALMLWISCHPVRSVMCAADSQDVASCRLCVCVPCSVLKYSPAAANLVQDSDLLGQAKTEKRQRPQSILSHLCHLSTAHGSSPMLHVGRLGRAIALDKLIQEAALMALQALNLKRHHKTQINKQREIARNPTNSNEGA